LTLGDACSYIPEFVENQDSARHTKKSRRGRVLADANATLGVGGRYGNRKADGGRHHRFLRPLNP